MNFHYYVFIKVLILNSSLTKVRRDIRVKFEPALCGLTRPYHVCSVLPEKYRYGIVWKRLQLVC